MTTTRKVFLIIGVLVFAFTAFGAYVGSTPEGKERSASRRAIELCWQEQERKSFDPATARFVAGACELMEDNFRRKWNREP